MSSWRVGILFSRSGVTGLTETEHFLGTALALEEINAAGGVGGHPIEPVVYDPQSDLGTYRRYAYRLLADEGVNVIFGGSTSGSRKAILPAIEQRNGLLWYPSLYEGFEYSPNVIYTGASPNQNSFPLAEFLTENYGKRIYFVGSDYIYPRESNRIMRDLIERRGGEVLAERYVRMQPDQGRLKAVIAEIARLEPDVVFSTVVGAGARSLYHLYGEAGFDRRRRPIASLTMAEGEIQAIGPERCSGHVTAATYFATVSGAANERFVTAFHRRYGSDKPVSMWSQTAYAQVYLFAQCLERSGSLDTQRLVEAALALEFAAPEGRIILEADNHHTWLTPRIGVAKDDGSFEVVWQARGPVRPDPYLASTSLDEVWLSA